MVCCAGVRELWFGVRVQACALVVSNGTAAHKASIAQDQRQRAADDSRSGVVRWDEIDFSRLYVIDFFV